MAPLRISITVEVEQKGNGLLVQRPVSIQMVHEDDAWWAECKDPGFETGRHKQFDQALLEGARLAQQELQLQVEERPLIAARITPEMARAYFPG